ncbi:Pkinase domain-containing protein [Rhizoctonia solani AG-1 IA]|uniref:Pkinase domain-containing protein n=1 Tax=Thanatephorus cucumeris (strain AG1-IA) TaxID=983506 RepID=L8X525_THACA|nr:Pkinase domain-containing protein [Rhizoctonia solani AG-1 IA]
MHSINQNPDPIIWVEDLSQSGTFEKVTKYYTSGKRYASESHLSTTLQKTIVSLSITEVVMLGSLDLNVRLYILQSRASNRSSVTLPVCSSEYVSVQYKGTDNMRDLYFHNDRLSSGTFGVVYKTYAHHEEPGRLREFIISGSDMTIATWIIILAPVLVMELAEYGDLQEYLKTHGPLSESLTRHIAWQVYQAVAPELNSLSSRARQSRRWSDILENILWNAKVSQHSMSPMCVLTGALVISYVAPEILQGAAGYGQMVDIYSLGVIFLFCMTGKWVLDYEALAILEVAGVSEDCKYFMRGGEYFTDMLHRYRFTAPVCAAATTGSHFGKRCTSASLVSWGIVHKVS